MTDDKPTKQGEVPKEPTEPRRAPRKPTAVELQAMLDEDDAAADRALLMTLFGVSLAIAEEIEP